MNPTRIAKATCGKTVKVYEQGSDWQVLTLGAKYPELWFTMHKSMSATDAVNRAIEYNGLMLLEFIK